MKTKLILKLFDSFNIQRWNDQVRPVDLVEIDKHGHKMAIAYCLAQYEKNVNWKDLIKGGVFELLRRSVLSDIKSPVFRLIRENYSDAYNEMNKWVLNKLSNYLEKGDIKDEFISYLKNDKSIDPTACRILDAAHVYSSYWEWQIIRKLNPSSPYIVKLNEKIYNDLENHLDLIGIRKLISKQKILNFIDLFGRLRFQLRWSQALRLPKTSVLGHSMFVACLTYFLTRRFNPCEERLKNNFFGGLFHDLPESVTRDIISPVKKQIIGLNGVITKIEKILMKEEVYPYLESNCKDEIEYYLNDEFECKIRIKDAVLKKDIKEINENYNKDKYHPIDGKLIKISDHLSAFIEARLALKNGFNSEHLKTGEKNLRQQYKSFKIAKININTIYKEVVDLTKKRSNE